MRRSRPRSAPWLLAAALSAPALVAAPRPARAEAAVASGRVDVDGDGDLDEVAVEARGVIVARIDGKPGDEFDRLEVAGTVTGATFAAARLGGGHRLLVQLAVTTGDGARVQHAVLLRFERGVLFGEWQGPVGPVGRDGDHAVTVAFEDGELYRYEVRPGIDRCDGQPARLFAQAWTGKEFRAVRLQPAVDPAAPTVTATAQAPAVAPSTSAVWRAAWASTQASATDASQLTRPRELDDGDAATVWTENRGKDGRGEFITFRATKAGSKLAGFRLLGGDARGAKELAASNRPRRLAVVTRTAAWWIEVPEASGAAALQPVWAMLPEPVATDCVTVVLGEVWPGKATKGGKRDVTAIAELVALADVDLAEGGGDRALVDDVIAGGLAADTATKQLARRGAAAARAIEAALADGARGLDAAARQRLVRALGAIGDAASAPVLGAALAAGPLDEATVEAAIDGLARAGAAGAAELARLVAAATAPDAARLAAIARLTLDAPDARDALIGGLAGSRAVRRAAALRLGEAPLDWLRARLDAAAAATDADAAGREADLWRALGVAAARADEAARGEAIAAARARAAQVEDYERRYRLIEALAGLDDARAVAAVREAVAALPADGTEPAALRQVAAAGLARVRADGAAVALADLADDGDPGVRLAALGALAGRDDLAGEGPWAAGASPDAVDRVLTTALSADRWPEVRRAAAVALGAACGRHGPTRALEGAAERDDDPQVRGDALTSLVQCGAPGVGARLFAVARAKDASPELRIHAVSLLAMLGDASLIDELITAFGRWRNEAFADEAALAVARQAAQTLGVLGAAADAQAAARAADALLAAARDGAFPELQAAALGGLGELGARCPAEASKLIAQLAGSDQVSVKLAAERARAMCGK